jgi:ubiquinone/menaquinone biosynthesis C-methylase UbiE
MNIDYARERDVRKSLQYRLMRRTYEVMSAIDDFAPKPFTDVIDLGTADAKMLNMVHARFQQARCVGIEYSQDLVDFAKAKFPYLKILQGDIQSLSFRDNSFDIAIATAVIEHTLEPGKFLGEAKRILRKGGIIILTSPDPFWEYLATKMGHLRDGQHNEVMTLQQLTNIATRSGFAILKAQKFMLSPVGMPFELPIERWLRRIHLDFLMANQLIIASC